MFEGQRDRVPALAAVLGCAALSWLTASPTPTPQSSIPGALELAIHKCLSRLRDSAQIAFSNDRARDSKKQDRP